jgi:hypothetical protein
MARMTKLVLMLPDSKTAQQFSGWLYLEGYPDRVLEQNTVTVDVPYDERDNMAGSSASNVVETISDATSKHSTSIPYRWRRTQSLPSRISAAATKTTAVLTERGRLRSASQCTTKCECLSRDGKSFAGHHCSPPTAGDRHRNPRRLCGYAAGTRIQTAGFINRRLRSGIVVCQKVPEAASK